MPEFTHEELSTLVHEHGRDLQRFLARRLSCAETAKDLVQDTFVRLLQASPKQALINPCVSVSDRDESHHRSSPPLTTSSDRCRLRYRCTGRQPDPCPSIETVVWSNQQVVLLKQSIAELPPKCRQVFILIKFHHLTHAEVATRLRISQSTVVKHMMKAVEYCKRRVPEQES